MLREFILLPCEILFKCEVETLILLVVISMTADVNNLGVVHESVGESKTVDGYFVNGELLF